MWGGRILGARAPYLDQWIDYTGRIDRASASSACVVAPNTWGSHAKWSTRPTQWRHNHGAGL